jgi:hypothetical protein
VKCSPDFGRKARLPNASEIIYTFLVKSDMGLLVKQLQYTSESGIARLSNGHLSDTFCVWLSNGRNKMADLA